MKQNDTALSPKHYKDFNIEAIAICSQFSFCLGNAFKYIIRAGKKDTYAKDGSKIDTYKQDLEKALVYLDFYKEALDNNLIKDEIKNSDFINILKLKSIFFYSNNNILKKIANCLNNTNIYEHFIANLKVRLVHEIEMENN